jgi:hypothetical protein
MKLSDRLFFGLIFFDTFVMETEVKKGTKLAIRSIIAVFVFSNKTHII